MLIRLYSGSLPATTETVSSKEHFGIMRILLTLANKGFSLGVDQ